MNELLFKSELFWLVAIPFGTLALGTIVRLMALRGRTDEKAKARRNSLKTWWGVVVTVVGVAVFGRTAAIVVFGAISLFAFLEFMRLKRVAATDHDMVSELTPSSGAASDRCLVTMGSLFILAHYACLWLNQTVLIVSLLPVASLIAGSIMLVLAGQASGYVSRLGHAYLGLMFTTYLLSHVVLLFRDSAADGSRLDAAACFLYVIALTELDDITQALVGRRVGKHKLSPVVSPNKTWEGFVGGMVVTMLLSIILGHVLLSCSWIESVFYAIILATAGLFGDLNMSAVKRDAEVKDSGNWLPGHGGLLDRIDSLTFTAPIFYYVYVQRLSS